MSPKMSDRMNTIAHCLDRPELSLDGQRDVLIAKIICVCASKEVPQSSGVSAHSNLDEFGLFAKKVELLTVNGEDPIT